MGNEYNNTKNASLDLNEYLINEERQPLSEFIRLMYFRYGFSKRKIKTILDEAFPEYAFSDDEDKIIKVV